MENKEKIISEVIEWAGNREAAETWYETEQIPALECTPSVAIQDGHFNEVIDYIAVIKLGGFA